MTLDINIVSKYNLFIILMNLLKVNSVSIKIQKKKFVFKMEHICHQFLKIIE